MAVRTTIPDSTTTAVAALIILLFSLQFAASRSPSNIRLPTESDDEPVTESEQTIKSVPFTRLRSETSKLSNDESRTYKTSIGDDIKVDQSEFEPESVKSVPSTRLRINDVRYFPKRFGFPGRSHCHRRHHHGGDTAIPTPRVTEIIRYVDDPAIPTEIIRYVDDTSSLAQPKKSPPVEEDFAKYVDEAEAAATQLKEAAAAYHSNHHAHPAEAEIVKYVDNVAAAQNKEPSLTEPTAAKKKEAKAELASRSRFNQLHHETVRYRDAAAVEAVRRPKEMKTEASAKKGDENEGFSKYTMKYNSRNFQRFGHQKFVKRLKRDGAEKKGDLTRIVKRIRKFLDF